MASRILGIICFILECVVFALVVIATPLDVLRFNKNFTALDVVPGKRTCYAMWGIKQCGSHKINPQKVAYWGFPTKDIYHIAQAAAAFAIISIATTLICVILTALVMCKCFGSAISALIMSIVCIVTIIICIGCLLGAYYHKIPGLGKVSDLTKLYTGVGVIVAGWCIQVIEFVLMLICACCC